MWWQGNDSVQFMRLICSMLMHSHTSSCRVITVQFPPQRPHAAFTWICRRAFGRAREMMIRTSQASRAGVECAAGGQWNSAEPQLKIQQGPAFVADLAGPAKRGIRLTLRGTHRRISNVHGKVGEKDQAPTQSAR
jgi:hypothetical protein